MQQTLTILEQVFGYASFRKGQAEIVEQILSGRDVLGVMPTGAGKSICFQVSALHFNGITIVISPLISLMADQVQTLVQSGVKAAYLNSSLTARQYHKVLKNIESNLYKIIYVAPERILTESFLVVAHQLNIAMVTVDEAHCLSQWGQDFRPSYLKIVDFINELPSRPIVTAFTATATGQVRDDIVGQLQMQQPYVLTTGFDRQNLTFSVKKSKDKMMALTDFLQIHQDECGIIYCATRKNVELVTASLQELGYSVTKYHAGLSDTERKNNQNDFLFDRCRVMVATNAFGMGIDKSNVSFVVHFNMPKNLENYYQEAGRAGRDGEPAECLLLYSGQNVMTNQFLIDHGEDNEELDSQTRTALRKKVHDLLKQMTFYCHTLDCLRAYILRYFGEKAESYCGNCSNCNENFQTEDVTIEAQKILSSVARLNGRFGVKIIVDLLRGKNNSRIQKLRLDEQTTFGILSTISETSIRNIINYLLLHGFLTTKNTDYPVLCLTNQSAAILRQETSIIMKVLCEEKSTVQEKTTTTQRTKHKQVKESRHEHLELFAALKQLRSKIATEQNVPAFVVFSDASLHDMCVKLPQTHLSFLDVSGVGHAKLSKYGDAFLAEIQAYCDQQGISQK